MLPDARLNWMKHGANAGRTLFLCGVLHAFTHLYQVALLPLYLAVQRDLGLRSVEEATLLLTVMMLSYFIPSYFMGVLADRFNKRKLLATGLAVNSLAFVFLAGSRDYGHAIAAMVLAGLGGSCFHPAATALVARLYPGSTGRALGLLGVGASVGFFAGPLYSGWRATAAGWRTPIFELGLAGLVAALLFLLLAGDEPTEPQVGEEATRTAPMFPSRLLWGIFLISAVFFAMRDFAGSSMGSMGSLFLQKGHGLDIARTGWILSTIFLASAISNPVLGGLSDRARVRWASLVLGVAAICVVLTPRVPIGSMAPLFAVYGFFFMASYPMVEAELMGAVPHSVRGRVFGLFITIGGVLGNLAHWIAGAWVAGLGPRGLSPAAYGSFYWMLGGLILLSLLGLPCLKALGRRERLEIKRPAPQDSN